jgi:hypothetical protein
MAEVFQKAVHTDDLDDNFIPEADQSFHVIAAVRLSCYDKEKRLK